MRRFGLILGLAASSACDGGRVSLVVDLYSDYRPGRDVARVEIEVEGVPMTSGRAIAADAALVDGIRPRAERSLPVQSSGHAPSAISSDASCSR